MIGNEYINIVVSSTVVYLFIVIGFRLFGKKELAQLSVSDLVFVLLISNAVQNAMVGSNTTLWGGLAAALTLFMVNMLFKYLLYHSKHVNNLMQGQPVVLISKGVINNLELKKNKITLDELNEAVREHGIDELRKVDLAVLEVDGNISILSGNYSKHTIKTFGRGRRHYKRSFSNFQN